MASIKKIEGKKGTSYKITVCLGRNAQGIQLRHYMTWKPPHIMTSRQAEKEVKRVACEFERNLEIGYQSDDRQTFEEYAKYVISLKEQNGAANNTIAVYRQFVHRLSPLIGHMKIRDIRPQHLNKIYNQLKQPGARKGRGRSSPIVNFKRIIADRGERQEDFAQKCGLCRDTIGILCKGQSISRKSADAISAILQKPYSELFRLEDNTLEISHNTIRRMHNFISVVFSQAEKEMLITFNPASKATPPKEFYDAPNYFQPDQIAKIIEAAEKEPIKWRMIVHMLIVSGARRGEIMALKWKNVDFTKKQICIDSCLSYTFGYGQYEGATKTRMNRIVPLPMETFEMLRKYRVWQMEQKLLYGDMWTDTDYVFTRETGGNMNPGAINSWLNGFTKRHGLPHINPHSFRHSAASIMIARGADIVSVSQMLGHKNANITMSVYAHAIEESKRSASECIADTILRKRHV